MKNSLETKLGIFVALTVIVAVLIIETLGDMDVFHRGYHVNSLFDTAQELKVGDAVKMAGIEIGRVDDIQPDYTNDKVRVTMRLHSDVIVKTDSTATIKFTGLMGQYFVSVDFGSPSAPKADDGTVLESTEQPDLNAVMAKLNDAANGIQNAMKGFTGDTINNLLGPLTDLIKQNSGHLTATITNLENITAQISSGQGTVGKLIYDQTFYDSALDSVSNLQSTIASARQIMSSVTNGQGTLGKLVTDDTLYNATTSSMTNLDQILLKINQGQGTVGKLVNDQEFYKNAKLSLQKLDKAADGLEDTGPLSVIGTTLSALGL
jgi:phospholipid/cholesterol/gamma-HCH transport system substrate-binding protein